MTKVKPGEAVHLVLLSEMDLGRVPFRGTCNSELTVLKSPNIEMHFLFIPFHIFLLVQVGRIHFKIKTIISTYILMTCVLDPAVLL